MNEVLKPDEDQLSTLANEMGIRVPEVPRTEKIQPRKERPAQKSYSQLT